jgi:hypothetical protein
VLRPPSLSVLPTNGYENTTQTVVIPSSSNSPLNDLELNVLEVKMLEFPNRDQYASNSIPRVWEY